MAIEILWCSACKLGVGKGEIPTTCPKCGLTPARWTNMLPADPTVPYALSENDRAFMKQRGILAEREDG